MIGEIARTLRFKYAKDVTGEIIIRTIKRHPFLNKITLSDCRNFQLSHIKKAITLPLKHVKSLSIDNCRKLSSQALFLMILNAPNLAHINITDSDVDDQFFLDLNPSIHIKRLSTLKSNSITAQGMQSLVMKYPKLIKLEISIEILTASMMFHILKLSELNELKVFYSSLEIIPSFKPASNIQIIEILPKENFTPNNSCFKL